MKLLMFSRALFKEIIGVFESTSIHFAQMKESDKLVGMNLINFARSIGWRWHFYYVKNCSMYS